MMAFTLADLEGYSMEMDDATIPVENFVIEGKNEASDTTCVLKFPEETKSFQGGRIADRVPAHLSNADGVVHSFVQAHVGNTRVYYMGTLTIFDGTTEAKYIYYTTDTQITNKTVYAVLKPEEKIALVYNHAEYFTVDYQLEDADGGAEEASAESWTLDEVFGVDRGRVIASGDGFSVSASIPRGYKAEFTVSEVTGKDEEGNPILNQLYTKKLGEMMSYYKSGDKLYLNNNSPKSMDRWADHSINNVTKDLVVKVKYQKVEALHFNARMWTQTVYARGRLQVVNQSGTPEDASDGNSNLTTGGHSFTWELYSNNGWEMDQLEINGETITVPMVTLDNQNAASETTVLSTDTTVELTVKSLGNGRRHYVLQIDNCYEDLTISGGNMLSITHREIVIHKLRGLVDPQYWETVDYNQQNRNQWNPMRQDTLIDKRQQYPNAPNSSYDITNPFRFKIQDGYEGIHVVLTNKEGTESLPYIQYLTKTDTSTTGRGTYDTVGYDQWGPSPDGYYYFSATQALDTFLKSGSKNAAVLLDIYADLIKYGLDYQNGADETETIGPKADNIGNMPAYQSGNLNNQKNGYNILNNPTALISNSIPLDKSGKFAFDHWEIVRPEQTAAEESHSKNPGESILVSDMVGSLKDYVKYDDAKERKVLTLKAVWTKADENTPIPYIVQYYLDFANNTPPVLIEEHTHTVNPGAMLVTDLYQDNNKTISNSIMGVLQCGNKNGKDYTEDANWKIDESRTTKMIDAVSLDNNVAKITLVKQTTSVTVTKTWDDYNNPSRPESIQVQLYKGTDTPVGDPATLKKDSWSHTFTGLDEIKNGNPIEYSVKEVNPPANYTSTPTGSGNSFTITNTIKKGSLTVTKTVAGINADETKEFEFTVKLDNTAINGEIEGVTYSNGVTTFKLKHGQEKVLKGLPVGVKYEVTETEANQGDYRTSVTNDGKGTITENGAVVAFTNTKGKGLTVSKTVEDVGGIEDTEFHFTVKLSDKTITGDYGQMQFKDGEASFTLKHDESKTATRLPANITYEVIETEANKNNYTTTSTGEQGTLTEENAGATAAFLNKKDTSTLTVSKTVKSNAIDENEAFHFTVVLDNENINGTFGQMEFEDGTAEFDLKHGEEITATGLPVGIEYEVTESEAFGYETTSTGDKGTISTTEAVAAFVNEKYVGSLKVSQTVGGSGAEIDREFHFRVTLSDKTINGTFGNMTFTNGVAEFTLTHEQTATATGLPAGIEYRVEETDHDQYGYKTFSGDTEGKISADEDAEVNFVNIKSTGSLVVSKVVSGNRGSVHKAFTFTVTLDDPSVEGEYGEMNFKNGVAVFKLRHGESLEARGLPDGVKYTVVESDNEGYRVKATGDSGEIKRTNWQLRSLTITSTSPPTSPAAIPPPATASPLWLAALTASTAALTVLLLAWKRKMR